MSEITPNTPNPVREDAYVEELAEKLGIDPQYIPKSPVWRNEEEIRAIAEMFANMSGSGGGVLVVHATVSETAITLDETFKQIEDGMTSGGVVIVDESEVSVSIYAVTGTHKESGGYEVYCPNDMTFSADSEDGYPYIDIG